MAVKRATKKPIKSKTKKTNNTRKVTARLVILGYMIDNQFYVN